jgi:hypothetical protein
MTLIRRIEKLESRTVVARVMPAVVPLDRPADVLSLLAEQTNLVRADVLAEPGEKARTLGFLAGLALRAMEARDGTARLEAIERVLRLRKEREKEGRG